MKIFSKASADLSRTLGQCFWIGLNGTTVEDSETQRIFETFTPGGVILFQRNVESLDQVRKMNRDLQKKAKIPLFLAVDQEGGLVERLHELIGGLPPAMALAATRKKRLIHQIHTSHANILRDLGFNVNFAPVLDLALADGRNGLGTRCFSDDPNLILHCARELISAHQKAGVLACGKHFPGLGDTHLDSHLDLPIVQRSWRKLQQADLIPYKKLLKELPFIMVNHALYPQKDKKLPASLSKEIVEKFLLEDWNYEGLAISDDLHMGAISKIYNLPEAAEHALFAGNQLFLICRPEGVVEAYKKLLRRADRDSNLAAKIYQSGSRLLAAKFPVNQVPEKTRNMRREIRKMEQYSQQVAEQAITLLQGEPLKKLPEELTVYLPRTKWLRNEISVFEAYGKNEGCNITERFYAPGIMVDEAARHAHASATEWNLVITADRGANPGQAVLLEELLRRGKKILVIEGAMPELPLPENIFVGVASYWTSPIAIQAAWKRITGERQATGKLPLQRERSLV